LKRFICRSPRPIGWCEFSARSLSKDVEHAPVLVSRTQKPLLYPTNLHRDLVQMSSVSSTRQPTPDLVGERLVEPQAPLPYGFMTDDDAAGSEDLVYDRFDFRPE
jgi:hypothetical protein